MKLRFESAKNAGIDAVFSMLREGAEWLAGRGIDYWQNWKDPSVPERKWIGDGYEAGEFYIVKDGESPVGMFRLQYRDELFWGKREDRAAYLHFFTTTVHGKGYGGRVLEMTGRKLRSEGIRFLRLDCGDVPGLCRYYENQGFVYVKTRRCFGYLTHFYQKLL